MGSAAPAFDPLGTDLPVVGTIVIVGIVAVVVVAGLLRKRGGPGAIPELAAIAVAAHRVSKVANGVRLVEDVSFQVPPGRVVGLLGPNGAGKTTLLGMVTGLITPTHGEVYLFGHPVAPGAPVLSRVGIAIEQPGLIPHLTGMQVLRTTWAVTGRPPEDARLDMVSALSGLGDALHRKVSRYSLGMRQRLALAQAMLGLPDVLLLDEPANGLDPAQVRQLRTILRDYAASGRTVLLSSHVLSEIEKICDEILVVHRGRLALTATVGDIARMTLLHVEFAGPNVVDAAVAALGKREITCRRNGDSSIDVTVGPQNSVTKVLRALVSVTVTTSSSG